MMRIPKRELKEFETIYFNTADYYLDEEEGIYDNATAEAEYKIVAEKINNLIDSYIIVSGLVGLWNGTRDIEPHYFNDFNEVISRLRDTMELSISFDKKEKAIIVKNIHHDGINVYYIRKPEWLTKEELKEMLEDYYDTREEMNDDVKYYFDKPLVKLNKDELIEMLSNCLER